MSIATLFREIFLRLNTLAEQLKTGLAGQRNTAEQTPEPESEIPETADPAGLSPIEPQELPADREDRPLSDAELTDIADRIAERLSNSQPETAPGSTDMPIRQVFSRSKRAMHFSARSPAKTGHPNRRQSSRRP